MNFKKIRDEISSKQVYRNIEVEVYRPKENKLYVAFVTVFENMDINTGWEAREVTFIDYGGIIGSNPKDWTIEDEKALKEFLLSSE